MSRISHLAARNAAIAGSVVAVAFACGPFFGIEVLQKRQQVLLAPPTVSFEAELRALAPPPKDKLPVVESGMVDNDQPSRASVETGQLAAPILAGVSAMRQQSSGDAAYHLGEALPPAIRLYTAGAVSFSHGDEESARAYFQKILALPAQERKSRELWVRFMLGRIAVEQANYSEAAAQFEAVRTTVRQGTPDKLGLAVASFGEQARGAWRQGDVANAVSLYAQQASYGSQSGANSLVMLAGLILNDANSLDKATQDKTARRLLFICVNGNSSRPFFVEPDPSHLAGPKIDRIVAALERNGLKQVDGAGLLASAAYSQGRFDIAQRLSALENVPISSWVQAKLALRKGDREGALKAYESALRSLPPAMGDGTSMKAEYAILRVSRRDYVQALDVFRRAIAGQENSSSEWGGFADYWGDAAYLAERVLTIEELRRYIDHNVGSDSAGVSVNSRLRSVLARRLMRAGRPRDAINFFHDPKIRSVAEQYNRALNAATSWWHLPKTKAQSWFEAAKLARVNGMELLGFEKEPDFAIWNGDFTPFDSYEPQGNAKDRQNPADPFESADERNRVAASKPARDVRFQYRLTAVEEATKSADLLPPRSQAFAAVLCHASRWVIDREPKEAERIYGRYLHQGAYVRWGGNFGRTCPAPDFAAASRWSSARRRMNNLAKHARVHPIYASLSALSATLLLAASLIYLRARRTK